MNEEAHRQLPLERIGNPDDGAFGDVRMPGEHPFHAETPIPTHRPE
jgi:hypothetical protein